MQPKSPIEQTKAQVWAKQRRINMQSAPQKPQTQHQTLPSIGTPRTSPVPLTEDTQLSRPAKMSRNADHTPVLSSNASCSAFAYARHARCGTDMWDLPNSTTLQLTNHMFSITSSQGLQAKVERVVILIAGWG